ncbi:Zinc finger FYVE domain-containing protein 26 [Orobanche hederae]
MPFWGVEIKPGKPFTHTYDGSKRTPPHFIGLGVTLRAINSSHSLIPIVDAIKMSTTFLFITFSIFFPQKMLPPQSSSQRVQRRVPNLSIDLSLSALPTCVLNNEFLSVLKLTRLLLDEIPNVKLPSLKFLLLESVTFTHYNYLTNILSACPILEELETKDLNVETNYRVAHPTPQIPYILQGGYPNWSELTFLGGILCIVSLTMRSICNYMWVFPYEPYNMFHNLTHLEITFDVAPNISMLKWDWLIFMLAKFPKLQTLIIDEVDTVTNLCKAEDWDDPKIVPECLFTHLTTCSLRNYSSINWELPFAKYIMQNSRVLSTMAIQVAKSVDSDAKLQIVKELSLCPKNSATCELLII